MRVAVCVAFTALFLALWALLGGTVFAATAAVWAVLAVIVSRQQREP